MAIDRVDDRVFVSANQELPWINKESVYLLEKKKRIIKITIPEREITVGITPTNFSENPLVPASSIYLIPLTKLVPHERPDPNLMIIPVNIDKVGWVGPAISGFLLDNQGRIATPPKNNHIEWFDYENIRAVVIDGANRTNTMCSLADFYQNPGRIPIVPFQAWDYFKLHMGKFDCSDFKASHQDVIDAALTGKLIPPKGSRHGIILWDREKRIVSPVALCQPVIEISLSNLFNL